MSLATFGNMGFMGIPLLLGIFSDPVVQVCIAVYTVIDMALLWTYGVYLCSRHQESSNPMSAIKNMVNPTTVTLLIAFIIMAVRFPVPGPAYEHDLRSREYEQVPDADIHRRRPGLCLGVKNGR